MGWCLFSEELKMSNQDEDESTKTSLPLRKHKPKFFLDIPKTVGELEARNLRKRQELVNIIGAETSLANHQWYFKSYEQLQVHRTMINDVIRTGSYLTAIIRNHHLFKDKTVLDVGCGTGVLSVFAVEHGNAKTVIAVDASAITECTQLLVKARKLEEKIKVVRGKMEALTQLPDDVKQVDIIITEWMGYGLFNESVLDAVITARKRFLRPGGFILPDTVVLKLQASSATKPAILTPKTLQDVKCALLTTENVQSELNLNFLSSLEAQFTVNMKVEPYEILSDWAMLKVVDMYYIQQNEVYIDQPFKLVCESRDTLRSFVLFFDVFFDLPNSWRFSTSSQASPTHWLQTVCALDKDEEMEVWRGTVISGKVQMHRIPALPRYWSVNIDYAVKWRNKESISRKKTFYFM